MSRGKPGVSASALRKSERAVVLGWTLREKVGPCRWLRWRKRAAKAAAQAENLP
jgi:hypothetical protein